MKRKKFLIKFGIFYMIIAGMIYFGLKTYAKNNFSEESLKKLITGTSKFRDVTDDLCRYQILGDPKVGKDYIKINFWCNNRSKARSTFALIAFEDKSSTGILKEYARIIGFDFNLIKNKNWYCTINDQELNEDLQKKEVSPASTIDCFQSKGLPKND